MSEVSRQECFPLPKYSGMFHSKSSRKCSLRNLFRFWSEGNIIRRFWSFIKRFRVSVLGSFLVWICSIKFPWKFNQKLSYDGILLGGLQLYIQSFMGRLFSCVSLDLKLSGIGNNVYKFPWKSCQRFHGRNVFSEVFSQKSSPSKCSWKLSRLDLFSWKFNQNY